MDDRILEHMIDLYAAGELEPDLAERLESLAEQNGEARRDMESLKATVELLRSSAPPAFTQDDYERILGKMWSLGAIKLQTEPDTRHLQYQLPNAG